jgi:ABC-type dipeptide/oligopeptide/nickel transport system permease component
MTRASMIDIRELIPHALDVGNYPVIQGIVLVTTAFVVVANGLVTSRWPRLRTA